MAAVNCSMYDAVAARSESPTARAMEAQIIGADVDAGAVNKKSGELYVERLCGLLIS